MKKEIEYPALKDFLAIRNEEDLYPLALKYMEEGLEMYDAANKVVNEAKRNRALATISSDTLGSSLYYQIQKELVNEAYEFLRRGECEFKDVEFEGFDNYSLEELSHFAEETGLYEFNFIDAKIPASGTLQYKVELLSKTRSFNVYIEGSFNREMKLVKITQGRF